MRRNFRQRSLMIRRVRRRSYGTAVLLVSKVIALVAVGFLSVSLALTGLAIRKAVIGLQADVHNTSANLNATVTDLHDQITQNLKNTMPLVNASIIHADFVLGDMQRVSALQEGYWKAFAAKSLLTVDRANDLLLSLQTTSNGFNEDGKTITASTVEALTALKPALLETTDVARAANKVLGDPSIPMTLTNINNGTKALTKAADAGAASAEDIQGKVHSLTHPSKWDRIKSNIIFGLTIFEKAAESSYYW